MEGSEPFLTLREAVLEIRSDVKDLAAKIDRIDRTGSIGTKAELEDHESRLRAVERGNQRLSGAWVTVGIIGSVLASCAGLALGVVTILSS